MCGISASIIKLNYNFKFEVSLKELSEQIEDLNLDYVYDKIKSLRTNEIFIKLAFGHKDYINYLKSIQNKIARLRNDKNFEIIDDIKWIIENELFLRSEKILNIIKECNLIKSPNLIIFLKNLLCELENINYLETRGRDSASLSFTVISNKKFGLTSSINSNNRLLSINTIDKNSYVLNVTIKYANQIGYTGENSNNILTKLINSKILSKINFNFAKKIIFMTHTRWATKGKVNLSNCHPLIVNDLRNYIFYSMNGDINNFDLLKNKYINPKTKIDKKCNNDLIILNEIFKKKHLKKLTGSFVILKHDLKKPGDISIIKNGSQGLYFSQDINNNLIVSSDVYGLVNRSDKFNIIRNNAKFNLNEITKKKFFEFTKFIKTDLSTRDLSKKNFNSYFLKEINDTNLFVKRTILNNVNFAKNKLNELHLFDKTTLKKFKDRKIKNIIFTGMGSCYTAAVGISKYLSHLFKVNQIHEIKIESTIASEGSGFYLKKNMTDTIIVVLAQSGTTIDTNVFAKKARELGAYTISIVNKKQGDVTYIVKKNIYLGNGRDVELSVPSTKTYTCHLIMGFILSQKILNIINKKDLKFIKNLKQILDQNIIEKSIKRISDNIKKLKIDPTSFKNWAVVYDESFNSFAALEYRIKLSECCYKSIPYFSIEKFNELNISNCLVFYIGSKEININEKKSNYIISISNSKTKNKNTQLIKLIYKDFIRNTLESAIALQLTSHHIATKIDLLSKKKFYNYPKKIVKFVLNADEFLKLKNFSNKNFNNILKDKLKRPVDTIKHQAKTITVGALREISKNMSHKKNEININVNQNKNDYKYFFNELKKNSYIYSDSRNEINKYFVCNIIERCNKLYSKNKLFYFRDFLLKDKKNKRDDTFLNFSSIAENKSINQFDKFTFHELIRLFLKNDNYSLLNENRLLEIKKLTLKYKKNYELNLSKHISNFNNVKFLGSGINYLVAKKFANIFSKKMNRTIAYDVIENHKHIDISSEPLLIVIASNINRSGFQIDTLSEVEKFISHNNNVILFSNLENNIYDKFIYENKNALPKIIKLPYIDELYSPCFFDYYFENLII